MSLSRLIIGDSILREIRYIRDCEVISLSGIKLEELLKYLKHQTNRTIDAKSILIHCGTNNIERDEPNEIVRKIKNIIDEIHSKNPSVKILVSSILPRPIDDEKNGHKVKIVNGQLKRKCVEWGAYFLASHKLMLKLGKPQVKFYRDGLHLNKDGVKRLRQFFSQRLAERGTKPRIDQHKTLYLRRADWSSY
jgi:lysophospholipase L1-like esterase